MNKIYNDDFIIKSKKYICDSIKNAPCMIYEPIQLNINSELLSAIISNCTYEEFNIIKNINLSGVCFDGVNVSGKDFSESIGVRINAQTVLDKCLRNVKLNGVEVIGSLDGVDVRRTDFTGCKGAKINPQTVWDKSLRFTNLSGVKIVGSFDGVNVRSTKFTGSIGAKINPQTVLDKSLANTELGGVEIVGSLDGVNVDRANFAGSTFDLRGDNNLEKIKILRK